MKAAICRIAGTMLIFFFHPSVSGQEKIKLELVKTITGSITPKSIIYAGNGYFFAQNMMYSHKITVYDRNYTLVKTIDDQVELTALGFPEYKGTYQGAPVEAAFSDNGRYVWVTNYQMSGDGFDHPGFDACGSGGDFDNSFVYRIDTRTFQIDAAIKAGSVPKYIAVTPNNKYALVSNWCSGDVSVIDISKMREVRKIPLGLYPRGIAVDSKSHYAYVAVMGSDRIAAVRLADFTVKTMDEIGRRPRHLCISPDNKFLFASLNAENQVVKIELAKQKVTASVSTGMAPRSMTLSADGKYLFVVNYKSGSLSVITTDDMEEIQNLPTAARPIGVAFDPETADVWVACYSGCIQIFKNTPERDAAVHPGTQEHSRQSYEFSIGPYHIIVGAFREERNLKKMMNRCLKAGYQPYIVNPESEVKKLSCMGFDSKADALLELNRAKDIFGEAAWILRLPVNTRTSK